MCCKPIRRSIRSFMFAAILSACCTDACAEPPASPEAIRDTALTRLREMDNAPFAGTEGNWGNRDYLQLVAPYLTGQITRDTYYRQRDTSPYFFDDIFGFDEVSTKAPNLMPMRASGYSSESIDDRYDCHLDKDAVNSLAAAYYTARDPVYLQRWLAIQQFISLHEREQYSAASAELRQVRKSCNGLETGQARALLKTGEHIAKALDAMAVLAKVADVPPGARLAWGPAALAPVSRPLTDGLRSRFDAHVLNDIAGGWARSYARDLLDHYSTPKYLPNQRFTGLYGLAKLSYFFEKQPDIARFTPEIDSDIVDFIQQISHKDGGMLEASFNYDMETAADYLRLSRIPGRPWTSMARTAFTRFDLQMAALASPQSGPPQVGNIVWGGGKMQGKYQPGDYRFTQTSIAFPYSGYYALRSDWSDQSPYLFFYAQRIARGHAMAGANSVQVGAYGRRLLIAGGIPDYGLPGKPDRDYPLADDYRSQTSSFKTNTVVVDGQSQAHGSTEGLRINGKGQPDATTVPAEPIQSRWHSSDSFDFVEGLHTGGYTGLEPGDVTHWRGVTFLRHLNAWVVVDMMRSHNPHRYTQIWKFAQPIVDKGGIQTEGFTLNQINTSDSARRITSNDTSSGAVNVSLRQFGPALHYTSYFGSDHGPYGYVGNSFFAGPGFSPDVHADFNGSGDQVVITVIRPFRGTAGDGVNQAIDVSTAGISGADLHIGGTTLAIRASAAPADLHAISQSAGAANLLIVEANGADVRTLVLGDPRQPGASYETGPTGRQPITIPTGFHWETDSGGAYKAVYR